jgi:putative transposase
LIEPGDSESLSVVMRDIMSNFAKWYNWRHSRKGHFWESRYHSTIVDRDEYALMCMRYIHRNPVRAGIVEKPWDYAWTSVKHNALGEKDKLIDDLSSFVGISPYAKVRMRLYQQWVQEPFDLERSKGAFYRPFVGSVDFVESMRKRHLG